jgi:endonuclease/exonuclease/phosphatase family metal-dependent hydrolase
MTTPLEPIVLGTPPTEPLPPEFSLSTWNVWFDKHLRAERNSALLEELSRHRPHVMLFQEVTLPFVRALQAAEWLRDGYWVSGIDHNEIGVVMVARVKCESLAFHPLTSQMGRRLLLADLGTVRVAGSHFESNRGSGEIREKQYAQTQEILQSCPPAVLAGDFNCEATAPESKSLKGRDAWSALNPTPGYTMDSQANPMLKSQRPSSMIQARIDRILCLGEVLPKSIQLVGTEPFQGEAYPSDHFGLHSWLKH